MVLFVLERFRNECLSLNEPFPEESSLLQRENSTNAIPTEKAPENHLEISNIVEHVWMRYFDDIGSNKPPKAEYCPDGSDFYTVL